MNGNKLLLTSEEYFSLIFNFPGAGRLAVRPGLWAVKDKLDFLSRSNRIDPITRIDALWFLNHERERGNPEK